MRLLRCPDANLMSCEATRRSANRHPHACQFVLPVAAQAELCVSSVRLRNRVSCSPFGNRCTGLTQLHQVRQTNGTWFLLNPFRISRLASSLDFIRRS